MTRRQLPAYIRTVADLMGLRDWAFAVMTDPAEEGYLCQVQCIYGQRHANIWVADDYFKRPATARRHGIVHELVHCHLFAQRQLVRGEAVRERFGDGFDLFAEGYQQAHEYATDALASVIAASMPLPPK